MEVPAVLPSPAYVLDPLFTHPGDPPKAPRFRHPRHVLLTEPYEAQTAPANPCMDPASNDIRTSHGTISRFRQRTVQIGVLPRQATTYHQAVLGVRMQEPCKNIGRNTVIGPFVARSKVNLLKAHRPWLLPTLLTIPSCSSTEILHSYCFPRRRVEPGRAHRPPIRTSMSPLSACEQAGRLAASLVIP
jgi:hypothetical protein